MRPVENPKIHFLFIFTANVLFEDNAELLEKSAIFSQESY